MARTVSLLDRVRIASPCSVGWANMQGDDRVRFCGQCQLNVYNISDMTRDEAETLIREREGRICGHLLLRRDGTVITKDCPAGVAAARRRLAKMAGGFAAMIGILIGCGAMLGIRENRIAKLRDMEPFARLARWLNPPIIIMEGDMSVP